MMPETRAQERTTAVYDLLKSQPGRRWKAAEVAIELGCDRRDASNSLFTLLKSSNFPDVVKGATGYAVRGRRRPATRAKASADGQKKVRSRQTRTAASESQAIRRYLDVLESKSERTGRRVSPQAMEAKLEQVEVDLTNGARSLKRLELIQRRRALRDALASSAEVDVESLEESFVEVAASFSERRGIAYASWREFGVPAGVLKRAGIQAPRSMTTS